MSEPAKLHQAQRGVEDMGSADFRRAAHQVADIVADYLEQLESLPVLPDLEPGQVRAKLPPSPPHEPEPLARLLDDYLELIAPNITQWQHPGFMAYFCSVASAPGMLAEWLASSLNSNVMFWRNAPASTELEELVVDWLRQMLGLPAGFDGMLTDTASVSTLTSVLAARHAIAGLDARERGLAGRSDVGPLRLYCSAEAHSSVDKAAIVAGVGAQGVRRIPTDTDFRLLPGALSEAIARDRDDGAVPFCVVATAGTTSSTSVDPLAAIAELCAREGLWLHVDAAYAGAAALAPEMRGHFEGWERADSIVVNPHKWMFTPLDASLLLFRRPEIYREAFSLVPEYLRTRQRGAAHDYHEYGIPLGRRFRALKLWFVIRYFGAHGMAERIRAHCAMAGELSGWLDESSDWQRLAPVPFSTVCFRCLPARLRARADEPETAAAIDQLNEQILATVNRSGQILLSHTKLAGRYALRVTLGNPRARHEHLERCWHLLQQAARQCAS